VEESSTDPQLSSQCGSKADECTMEGFVIGLTPCGGSFATRAQRALPIDAQPAILKWAYR
jgi:hypothetical protein